VICKTLFPPAFILDTHQVDPGGSTDGRSLHAIFVNVIVVESQNVAPFQYPYELLYIPAHAILLLYAFQSETGVGPAVVVVVVVGHAMHEVDETAEILSTFTYNLDCPPTANQISVNPTKSPFVLVTVFESQILELLKVTVTVFAIPEQTTT
jgi:hypothetical protein